MNQIVITVTRCCDRCKKPMEISEKWLALHSQDTIVCLDCEREIRVKTIQKYLKTSKNV